MLPAVGSDGVKSHPGQHQPSPGSDLWRAEETMTMVPEMSVPKPAEQHESGYYEDGCDSDSELDTGYECAEDTIVARARTRSAEDHDDDDSQDDSPCYSPCVPDQNGNEPAVKIDEELLNCSFDSIKPIDPKNRRKCKSTI